MPQLKKWNLRLLPMRITPVMSMEVTVRHHVVSWVGRRSKLPTGWPETRQASQPRRKQGMILLLYIGERLFSHCLGLA